LILSANEWLNFSQRETRFYFHLMRKCNLFQDSPLLHHFLCNFPSNNQSQLDEIPKQVTAARNYPFEHYQILLAPLPSSHHPTGCSRRSGRQSQSGGTLGFGTCCPCISCIQGHRVGRAQASPVGQAQSRLL